jgi:hypothetical protein
VTITGTNFTGVSSVMFGSEPAEGFTVNSSTSITAIAPDAAAATIDVTVTTVNGTSATSSADHYTYTGGSSPSVSSLSTQLGDSAGNNTYVTITGSNFLGTTEVDFGATPADFLVINSGSQIVALAPAHAAGTLDVTVTNHTGTSSTSSATHFTYVDAPVVSSLGVSSGSTAGGTSLTITGSNFTGAYGIEFGDTLVTDFTLTSDTSITVSTPPHPAGVYDLRVVNANGESALSSTARFTYLSAPAPVVSSLGTSSGGTAGGTVFTINGSDFGGLQDVLFGSVEASSFALNGAGQITAVAPPQAAATVDVRVVTTAGESAAVSADHFTYSNSTAPSVSGVSPSSGSTAGGAVVTVTGSHFLGATDVLFGSVSATSFTVLSDDTLVATAPVQAAGTVDVQVE